MAEKVTLARPYAKAAFEAARDSKDFARWSEMLAAAAATVADERVVKLLSSPRVQPADLVELTVQGVSDGEVSPYLTQVLDVGDQVELRGQEAHLLDRADGR